jgi:transposase
MGPPSVDARKEPVPARLGKHRARRDAMSTTAAERYAGVDVSKARLEVSLMPEGEAFTLSNDQEGIDSLIEHLQGVRPELVVLDASGRYERPAAAAIAAASIPVAVVNPRQARA